MHWKLTVKYRYSCADLERGGSVQTPPPPSPWKNFNFCQFWLHAHIVILESSVTVIFTKCLCVGSLVRHWRSGGGQTEIKTGRWMAPQTPRGLQQNGNHPTSGNSHVWPSRLLQDYDCQGSCHWEWFEFPGSKGRECVRVNLCYDV